MLLLSLALGCVLFVTGCGGGDSKGPQTTQVTGVVKYKDTPIEGATVTFVPAESATSQSMQGKGNAAFGMTDKNGVYTLRSTTNADGAVAGNYIVTVTKYEVVASAAVPDVDSPDYNPDAPAAPAQPPKNELPAKYADIKTSDLKAEVSSSGKQTFDWDLKD